MLKYHQQKRERRARGRGGCHAGELVIFRAFYGRNPFKNEGRGETINDISRDFNDAAATLLLTFFRKYYPEANLIPCPRLNNVTFSSTIHVKNLLLPATYTRMYKYRL